MVRLSRWALAVATVGMQVLYQLSYVGAKAQPTVIAADRDTIPAPNNQPMTRVAWGVFWGNCLGSFWGKVPENES
jgi:hypothetical protein